MYSNKLFFFSFILKCLPTASFVTTNFFPLSVVYKNYRLYRATFFNFCWKCYHLNSSILTVELQTALEIYIFGYTLTFFHCPRTIYTSFGVLDCILFHKSSCRSKSLCRISEGHRMIVMVDIVLLSHKLYTSTMQKLRKR